MSIGENIKNFREKKGMTQQQLADAICVTRPWITQIERGTKIPSALLIAELARVFGCDINDFYQ